MSKKIVILFSDTGGGHRSAGEAIAEALTARYGTEARVQMVDILKDYAPYLFNRLPDWYPGMLRHRWLWGLGYRATDEMCRSRLIGALVWPYVRSTMRRVIQDHPADVYVAVWVYLLPLLRALGLPRPPVITVVTDLVSIHAWWCHPQSDLCLVPTEPARQRLIWNGIAPEKVRVVGLPVAARFCGPVGEKTALRAQLGWGVKRPVVLLMSGGEGTGPVYPIAQALSASGLDCELAVVAGRNEALHTLLRATVWQIPTHIYGFVREIPEFMRAADVLVTKAGPSTLSEAFTIGLPLIIYDFLPGQETGNVSYVEQAGAGLFASGPTAVVTALRRWIGPAAEPQALVQAARNSQRLARPDAAQQCAALIWQSVRGSGQV